MTTISQDISRQYPLCSTIKTVSIEIAYETFKWLNTIDGLKNLIFTPLGLFTSLLKVCDYPISENLQIMSHDIRKLKIFLNATGVFTKIEEVFKKNTETRECFYIKGYDIGSQENSEIVKIMIPLTRVDVISKKAAQIFSWSSSFIDCLYYLRQNSVVVIDDKWSGKISNLHLFSNLFIAAQHLFHESYFVYSIKKNYKLELTRDEKITSNTKIALSSLVLTIFALDTLLLAGYNSKLGDQIKISIAIAHTGLAFFKHYREAFIKKGGLRYQNFHEC